MDFNKGDLVWANLEPVKPGEQGKIRPCVIVSANSINHSAHPCVIICPITGKENMRKSYPTHISLQKGSFGLDKDSVIMAEQIRTIAKERIDQDKRSFKITSEVMDRLELAIKRVLDFSAQN